MSKVKTPAEISDLIAKCIANMNYTGCVVNKDKIETILEQWAARLQPLADESNSEDTCEDRCCYCGSEKIVHDLTGFCTNCRTTYLQRAEERGWNRGAAAAREEIANFIGRGLTGISQVYSNMARALPLPTYKKEGE